MITVPCKHQRMDCPACGRIVILRWPFAAIYRIGGPK